MTTPGPLDTLNLVHRLSEQLAQYSAAHADHDDLARLMAALDGKANSTIIVFAAIALRQTADDIAADGDRPADFAPELVLPILIATVGELVRNMTITRTPIPPEDLH